MTPAERSAQRGDALAIAVLLALGGLQGAWWILKWLGGKPWPGQGRTREALTPHRP